MDNDTKLVLPEILKSQDVAKSRLVTVEAIDLKFSNGELRTYEKIKGAGRGAVLIVPMLDDETIILIREYCAGTHSYQLGFPKGLIDPGEQASEAANRELQEEIGFAATEIDYIHKVSLAPAFFNATMELFVARGLYESRLEGDEPEPLQVVHWKLKDYQQLLAQPDFTEARSITALMLLLDRIKG
ncbi:ADP compounds hydrolase NudE [Thalassotalea sp. HSM 43]|uniref:ADP compounds hydrolase NudE n=1 Tax=Thalassotalea sp. HSM 43 TaxID=2552945 RepID=UPI001080E841|nr:ADP compounds hydrolase NudE [Thalassotalea sp. HSM 43]QBY04014.1 ADP compounds hydrolase NudE [Thalassotalea sp. HSM 43]